MRNQSKQRKQSHCRFALHQVAQEKKDNSPKPKQNPGLNNKAICSAQIRPSKHLHFLFVELYCDSNMQKVSIPE